MVNMRRYSFYLLLVLALAACSVGERRRETIARDWPASSISRIELHEANGSVNVEAWSGDRITLSADVFARGVEPRANAENKGYFQSVVDGDTLRIGSLRRRKHAHFKWLGGTNLSINYTLRVPAAVSLDLETVNGRISTRGVNGETEVTTVNGPVDLETPGGSEVSLKTINGPVKATFLQTFRGATLKTVNGSVRATLPPEASFACDLSQVNGDFEASFPLSIHSYPGNRRVSGEVNGGRHELRITTVNGDIRLDTVPMAPAAPAIPAVPPVPPPPAT